MTNLKVHENNIYKDVCCTILYLVKGKKKKKKKEEEREGKRNKLSINGELVK